MEVMDMLTLVSFKSPKEPTRLNGMVVITMKENFGDSNCAAMTTKIRNTATAIALYRPGELLLHHTVSGVGATDNGSGQVRADNPIIDFGFFTAALELLST